MMSVTSRIASTSSSTRDRPRPALRRLLMKDGSSGGGLKASATENSLIAAWLLGADTLSRGSAMETRRTSRCAGRSERSGGRSRNEGEGAYAGNASALTGRLRKLLDGFAADLEHLVE